MKNTILYVFCLTSIVFLSSCGKVVDLEYQNNYDRLVVEALLVKDESTHKIKVSHEINYFETPEFKPAEDVIITISDESGNIGTFYYIDSGYFGLDNYNINYNTNYTLSLKDGDKIVEASCKTSSEIILDTVLTTYYALDNENSTTALKPIFIDPANEKNYYLTGFSEIGFTQNNYYSKYSMFTDELMDGQTNNNAIPVYYQSGDTIEFRLRSVDYYRYQFIKTFEESYNDGGFFNASPSNPISNFKDQALGYFSVEVEERMTVLIP
ncbi:DUF4249 domain-containing protein [Brumimicrobium mesophilum]|uniref:DUF4249 family protein n=1 Tax=Brumimicrobium mesophilum TaxID=392717 RepID=UPI00131DC392|nr:DUF4249 family protein [Brumimicrobium mesophilum]